MKNLHKIVKAKDKDTLDEIFLTADCPTLGEFKGEYKVKMLSWYLPDFSRWDHRKVITEGEGVNVFWNNTRWGRFYLKYKIILGVKYAVVFDYKRSGIRDHLRKVDDGLYLGTFNYLLMGKVRFIGYFLLVRANKKGEKTNG